MTTDTTNATSTGSQDAGQRVLIGLTHSTDDPESVLIAYLMAVEAMRAGKDAVLWLTKSGVEVAVKGAVDEISVPGAPSLSDLHAEYVELGGRIFACPVCVKLRGLTDATWAENTEVVGAPSVYDYTAGGALVFNY